MLALVVTVAGRAAHAAAPSGEPPRATFALIVGVNASPAPDVAPLHYADDDAARYLDLFRALRARTYVLARLDANTRALHPQAAAEALAPRRAELRAAVDSLARDIAQARARGVQSAVYVVYAGHGEVRNGSWYLTLEDARLADSEWMTEVVDRLGADHSHVIIDACHADLIAQARGPGGARRTLSGFVERDAASRAGRIGFLLSSSDSGESHEWAGFEAGVFSHEVRSGLYGAADADGDGIVTYREIAAFVARANEAIVNQRYRPRVVARAPRSGDVLLDLRPQRGIGLKLAGGAGAAHHLLEDAQGVRLLDFHGSVTTPINLVKPPGQGPLYLRRVSDGVEWLVPRVDGVVELDRLAPTPARAHPRGAAHEAFGRIFTLAFDEQAVAAWTRSEADVQAAIDRSARARDNDAQHTRLRRVVGWGAIGVAAAAAASAIAVEVSAQRLSAAAPEGESHLQAIARNERIDSRNHAALGLAVGAVGVAATGALLLLWPTHAAQVPELDIATSPSGAQLGARWRF